MSDLAICVIALAPVALTTGVPSAAPLARPRVPRAARAVVGGNKRRFKEKGFDLDLVYVTDSLIGMSVPAVGGMSLYRNPIDEGRP